MMLNKKIARIIFSLVALTTLPFFLLLLTIDHSLISTDMEIYLLQLAGVLGNIFGLIGVILMLWQFMLGVRFIVKFFTPDLVSATKIHTLLGKYGVLLILIHPFLVMYSYLEDLLWVFLPDLSSSTGIFIGLGRIAFMLLLLVYFTSALLRSKLKYRPWLYIHYLTYPIITLAFLHSILIGTFLNEFIILRALWFSLFAIFLLLVGYRLLRFAGIFGDKYTLISSEDFGSDRQFIKIMGNKKIENKTGQFYYLQMRRFGESHPFSVMHSDKDEKILSFAFNKVGSFTRGLSELTLGHELTLDGPYGVFTLEGQNRDPKVILAGGIGITPFIELIKNFSTNETYLFYSVREFDQILEKEMLSAKLGDRLVVCNSRGGSDDSRATNCRIDENVIYNKIGEKELDKYRYFICGSVEYISGMREMLKKMGVDRSKVFYEEFEL